ncbi:MAG: hypothetical protein ACAI35_28250 [Candidatus Methylacidiphilales bacterium]|nr:hypothetical protein [Candidatus Methylacidiphilales bacterium]
MQYLVLGAEILTGHPLKDEFGDPHTKLDYHALPLSNNLKQRIHDWDIASSAVLNALMRGLCKKEFEESFRTMDAEGIALARCIAHELGDAVKIKYYSEDKAIWISVE